MLRRLLRTKMTLSLLIPPIVGSSSTRKIPALLDCFNRTTQFGTYIIRKKNESSAEIVIANWMAIAYVQ
jgi:hypothetical protein